MLNPDFINEKSVPVRGLPLNLRITPLEIPRIIQISEMNKPTKILLLNKNVIDNVNKIKNEL